MDNLLPLAVSFFPDPGSETGLYILISLLYLAGAIGFVLSLKWMSDAKTARKGIFAGEIGFVLAIIGTLLLPSITTTGYIYIAVAMLIGAAIGVPLGLLVPMTAMPQRIALSHAFGALAAGLVGIAKFYDATPDINWFVMAVLGVEIVLGALVFTGSLMAAGKLQEVQWLAQRPVVFPLQQTLNFAVLGLAAVMVIILAIDPSQVWAIPVIILAGLTFGVLLIIPIGGADMPTVIALLNSYAGIAAALLGFVLENNLLIVAGALDGMSGLILSIIMCRAMNRSFRNVLFGAFGATEAEWGDREVGSIRSASFDEAGEILRNSRLVVVVPGYGMAVAQAQHKVRELADTLEKEGVEVKYAIHPVAGRMPGHMNVLLAEANVPYEQLMDMEEINPEFPQADVVLVLGANDVVNPAARHDQSSPIYGMPILDVDKAATVMVVKRSMRPGFAGVENELFFNEKTLMVFGDAKDVMGELITEISGNRDSINV
ncbi:MAG: NAD(P)(+) transhydrogenase (Re/Si-specific) subunit beta [Actinobacteria bacterium]|nr:NAD(P)(+) transhydrogenase (Re/Si-specific) subunit beta [Actinomycetota bacterium]